MKWIVTLLLSATLVAAQATKPRDAGKRPLKQYTMEQFLATTSVTGGFFSPDESRLLFSSNRTGIWNAYTIPVAGGPWTPVTKSTKESTYAVSFFRHDDRRLRFLDQYLKGN